MQKQLLKYGRQNSYLHLWPYTLYITWHGVHLLVRYRLEEKLINKLPKRNLSQAFLQALTSAQKLYCRTTIFEEPLLMTASVLKYDHDIIIIKSAQNLKLFSYGEVAGRWTKKNLLILYYLWKKLSKFSSERKKVFHAFSFRRFSTANSESSFNVQLLKLIPSKFK